MMKKLLVFMLVLGMASMANATLSWSVSAITIDQTTPEVVTINSSDANPYPTKWIDDTAAGLISSIVARPGPAPGDDYVVQDPVASGWADWWTVEAADLSPPSSIVSGPQWDVTLDGSGASASTYTIYLDTYGVNVPLAVTVIPEPATIALLGLGGLFLRRRR